MRFVLRRTLTGLVVTSLLSIAFVTPAGAAGVRWERTWGLNVDSVNPSTGPEVCTVRPNCTGGTASGVAGSVFPAGVAASPSGHVYVAEFSFNRIQEFDAAGGFVRMWGRDVVSGNAETGFEVCEAPSICKAGTAGTAGGEFTQPYGVTTDAAGHVLVTDENNNRVEEFTATGGFVRAWGRDVSSGTAGDGLEVCTVASDCKAGVVTATNAGGGKGGFLVAPVGIAVDAAGYVYVANQANRRVERFTPAAAFDRAWGQGVVTPNGTAPEICTVAASCTTGGSLGGEGGNVGLPTGLALDADGNVYVFESIAYRMEKFTAQGAWLRAWGKNVDSVAGGTGYEVCTVAARCKRGETGTAGGEFINAPPGPMAPDNDAVAVDASGTVYVADRSNARIQAFDADGGFLRTWGTNVNLTADPGGGFQTCFVAAQCGPGAQDGAGGGMQTPTGVAAAADGTVYESDQIGNRLQAFSCPSGAVHLSGTSYTTGESGNATVTVTRTGEDACAATARYATADGTASAGSDYTATQGTVTFPAGVNTQVIQVPITADGTHESDETFSVSLSAPGGGATLSAPSAAVVTITDDDTIDTLRFTAATRTVSESGPSVLLTVERVGDHRNAVSLGYATANGSALAGFDYTTTSGTLSFADGEATKSFSVPILDDGTHEDDETFTVTLSGAGGNAIIGAPSTTTVTVTDDDVIDTSITAGPDGPTNDPSPQFRFVASPAAGASFECALDGAAPASCSSPFTSPRLPDGPHTLTVTGIAPGGQRDGTPATRAFFVDTVAPVTTLGVEAQPGFGSQPGPGNRFIGRVLLRRSVLDPDPTPGGGTISCELDPPSAPLTPEQINGGSCPLVVETTGTHTLYGASVDAAGNREAAVRSISFEILGPPDTTITGGPGTTYNSTPSFTFVSDTARATFRCRVDQGPWSPCTSPYRIPNELSSGGHLFDADAISPDGAVDPTPARRSFTVSPTETRTGHCEDDGAASIARGNSRDLGPACTITSKPCPAKARCVASSETCPVGATCTFTVHHVITEADSNNGWFCVTPVTFDTGTTGISFPTGVVATYTSQTCNERYTFTYVGDGRAVSFSCDSKNAGTEFPSASRVYGADSDRRVTCDVSFTIKKSAALDTTVAGQDLTTYAPTGGTVGVASAPGGKARIARVAAAFKSAKKAVRAAGPVRFRLKLSRDAALRLARTHALKLIVLVTLKPAGGGKATSRKVTVTLRTPKPTRVCRRLKPGGKITCKTVKVKR